MTEDDKRVGIARIVCSRFVNNNVKTPEHGLLVEFKDPNLLQNMLLRNQLRSDSQRDKFHPSVGTFVLLGDKDELYQCAHFSFCSTVPLLWKLFCAHGDGHTYTVDQLVALGKDTNQTGELDSEVLLLGLYLSSEFGALSPIGWSEDTLRVNNFGVSKHVITMEDPDTVWNQRIESIRVVEQPAVSDVGARFGLGGDPEDFDLGESFPTEGFWSLIHPSISEEVRRRFMIGEYADAVLAALQVVSQAIRDKTGLREDGARLMAQAFSGDHPLLIFDDPLPLTQESLQSGYQQIFAGAMKGIRNPKAHSLVSIDRTRCIHFLFLASLLAHKVEEAVSSSTSTSQG